ncbi:MAG: hypothetical protein JOZ51_14700, partial [Chloroflexi bacterium]|nr:hypothetical protein [Chloroflexota bacterium]
MFDDIRASYFPAELGSGITAISVDSSTFWQALETVGEQDSPFSSLSELGNYTMP